MPKQKEKRAILWGDWSEWVWEQESQNFHRARISNLGHLEHQYRVQGDDRVSETPRRPPPMDELSRAMSRVSMGSQEGPTFYSLGAQETAQTTAWSPAYAQGTHHDENVEDDDGAEGLQGTYYDNHGDSSPTMVGGVHGYETAPGPSNPADDNEYLPSYFKIHKSREFWAGRIVNLYYSEPRGYNPTAVSATYVWKKRDLTWAGLRPFVIYAADRGHAYALPIYTHGGRGMAKPGAHQENYGLIYDDRAGPSESEAEHNIVYGPIPARMYAGHRMADGSYINYSKTKTIEHNVPVGFIGELKPKYLKKLQENQEHRYSKKDPGGGTRRGGESSKKGGESSKKSSKKDRDDHDDHHRRHRRRDHDGRA